MFCVSLSKMTESILEICHDYMSQVLKQVCEDHNLNYQEILKKYLPDRDGTNREGSSGASTSAGGSSATRKKSSSSSKKNKQDYLEVIEYKHGDDVYYMDKKMNIYSHDKDAPKLLGIKLVDGTIKFY